MKTQLLLLKNLEKLWKKLEKFIEKYNFKNEKKVREICSFGKLIKNRPNSEANVDQICLSTIFHKVIWVSRIFQKIHLKSFQSNPMKF